jgi:hypothetical protein
LGLSEPSVFDGNNDWWFYADDVFISLVS